MQSASLPPHQIWLRSKIEALGTPLAPGEVFFLKVEGWNTKAIPIENKRMAKLALSEITKGFKNQVALFRTKMAVDFFEGLFGPEIQEAVVNQSHPVTGNPDETSWIDCFTQSLARFNDVAPYGKWKTQKFQDEEALTAALHQFGKHTLPLAKKVDEWIQEITHVNPSPASQIKILNELFEITISTMNPKDQAVLLFGDSKKIWVNGCVKWLKTNINFFEIFGEPVYNCAVLWDTVCKNRPLQEFKWMEESREAYYNLIVRTDAVWKKMTTKTHPDGGTYSTLSPSQTITLESIIRGQLHKDYELVLKNWNDNPEVIQFNSDLIATYKGADCRPTGFWMKGHIKKFLTDNIGGLDPHQPSFGMSTPFADDLAKDRGAAKTMEMIREENQLVLETVRGESEDWETSEGAIFLVPEDAHGKRMAEAGKKLVQDAVDVMQFLQYATGLNETVGQIVFEGSYQIPERFKTSPKIWWDYTKAATAKNIILACTPSEPKQLREAVAKNFDEVTDPFLTSSAMAALNFSLVDCGNPSYYLPKPMLEALQATQLDGNQKGTSISFPLDAAVFHLEEGSLTTKNGRVNFEVIAMTVVDTMVGCAIPGVPALGITPKKGPRLVVVAIGKTEKGEMICCGSDNSLHHTIQKITSESHEQAMIRVAEELGKTASHGAFSQAELQEVSRSLPAIAIKLAMVMKAREDLVEDPSWWNESTTKKSLRKANFLGRDYTPKQGSSPQAGSFKLSREAPIWIEPILPTKS
jgi:hypothetical protein